MKKHLHILIILFIVLASNGYAQKAYFEIRHGSVEMQTREYGDSTLAFYYVAIYHADSAAGPYTGYISTYYKTAKNSKPSKSIDSVNVAKTVFGGQLNNGDSAQVFGHIRIGEGYFRNGPNNIIVVWPTGAKSTGGYKVGCVDSVTYYKNITISNIAGIPNDKNAFNPVKLFPNPTSNYLNLQLTDPAVTLKFVRITDISGKEVFNQDGNMEKIDVSALKSGLYFLEVNCTDKRKAVYSFIIGK